MYMTRIVSEIVPRNVVIQANLNTVARNECDVGYTRYRIRATWGINSAIMSNAPHTVHSMNSMLDSGAPSTLIVIAAWATKMLPM